MNDLMIFCTASSQNYEKYFKYILAWYKQLKSVKALQEFNPSYNVFSDGSVNEEMLQKIFPEEDFNIFKNEIRIFSYEPHIGIHGTNNNFKGWKRSFMNALIEGRKYQKIVHIENDLRILNWPKFISHIKQVNKSFCGYCQKHRFIESACMILNDKVKNQKLISQFEKDFKDNNSAITENVIKNVLNPEVILKGTRNQNLNAQPKSLLESLEYIGNIYIQNFPTEILKKTIYQ